MSGVLGSIGILLSFALELISWMIIIRVLLSWVSPDPYNPIVQFLSRATDPILRPIQRRMPHLGGLDLSPIVALLLIMVLQKFVAVLFSPGLGGGGAFVVLLADIIKLVHLLGTFFMLMLVARFGMAFFAWLCFRQRRPSTLNLYHPASQFILRGTEPMVARFRRWTPTVFGLDVSALLSAFVMLLILAMLQDLAALLIASIAGGGAA